MRLKNSTETKQERQKMSWEDNDNIREVVPYVPGEQPKISNVIKLNTNECPYPPAPEVKKAMQSMSYEDLRLYPDPDVSELTGALSEYYSVPQDQIFVGVGSDDVLSMSFMTFFNSGRPVLFPDITYSFYDVWASLYRIPYRRIPLDDSFRINAADYDVPCGGIVIPNPNAPTGIAEPLGFFEDIVKRHPDEVVIIDEAYIDFGGESCLPLIDKYENLLVVQTFSKSRAMAGMRIGYAFGSRKLIHYLMNVKFSYNSYTMNRPSIIMGKASVMSDAYFRETCAKITATRERAQEKLKGLGFTCTDSSANFMFASHATVPAGEIFRELKGKGIFVRYFDKPRIDNYLRITVGTDEQMDRFCEALKDILAD